MAYFSVIPIHWLLTVDSEMACSFSIPFLKVCLFSFKTYAVQENFIAKLVNAKVYFTRKNQYRTHRFVIHAILVFSIKFTMEFTSWAMNFSLEESKENDLIIKAATRNIKRWTI